MPKRSICDAKTRMIDSKPDPAKDSQRSRDPPPDEVMAQMLRMQIGPDVPEEMLANTLTAMAATAKLGWNPLLHNPRLAGRLHRITSPTLCLWGEQDRVVSSAYAREFARLIPNAEVQLIPEAGHLASLEKTEEWVAAVVGFLGRGS